MRIVLDANLSPKLVPRLAQADHDVVHVGDLGMRTATGAATLARCQADGRVRVTADTEVSMAHDPGLAVVVGRLPLGNRDECSASDHIRVSSSTRRPQIPKGRHRPPIRPTVDAEAARHRGRPLISGDHRSTHTASNALPDSSLC